MAVGARLLVGLKAIFGKAPMGPTEALVLVVTTGAVILGEWVFQPKPNDPALIGWLWWIVLIGATLLFMRGLVGLFAWLLPGPYRVVRTAFVSTITTIKSFVLRLDLGNYQRIARLEKSVSDLERTVSQLREPTRLGIARSEPITASTERPMPTVRQRQTAEFQGDARTLIDAGDTLDENLRLIPEDAPAKDIERWRPRVEAYEADVSTFIQRWGDTQRVGGNAVVSLFEGLHARDAATVVVPGPAARRDLVERVQIARVRVERRLNNAA